MSPKARMILDKLAGVVDNTVSEINELQMGYRHVKQPFTEANARTRLYKQGALVGKLLTDYREGVKVLAGRGVKTTPALQSFIEQRATSLPDAAQIHKSILGTATARAKKTSLKDPGVFATPKTAEHIKVAIIRKQQDGYHIYSHKGKHLGGPYSEGRAKKRLAEIEYFKKQGTYTNKERTVSSLAGGATAASAVALASKLKRMRTNPLVAMGAVALGATLGATTPVSFHTVRHRKKHAGYKPIPGLKRVGASYMEPALAEQTKKLLTTPAINQIGKM